ncbi:MAG: YkvA family protein [Anaerolineae bacterium]|nr:YkvA family protein [Thermoflexales bacterium]MDW8407989.1 YkvA family protein [Anaerolineae bacterium]
MTVNPNSDPNRSARPNMSLFMSLVNRLRLTWRLMTDRRVPVWLKVIPFAPALYLLWPADLLPDLFPFLGQLDDLGMFLLGMETFIALAPREVVAEHQAELEAGSTRRTRSNPNDVVDGEWRRVK